MSLFDQLGKIVPAPNASVPTPGIPAAQGNPSQENSAYLTALEQSKVAASQKLSELYLKLGKTYYESHADDHQTEYEESLTAIRDVHAEIAKCRQQVEEIENRRRCPTCGAELVEGSKFCNICGAKLSDPPGEAAGQGQEPILCPQCKAVLSPEDIFCTSCGADLRR